MSQAKVDKYKQDKKNRKKIMAKQKRNQFLGSALFTVVILAFVFYLGFSIYDSKFKDDNKSTEPVTYSLSEEEVSSVWTAATTEEETTTPAGETTDKDENSNSETKAEENSEEKPSDEEAE